ncbi:hypothetical protein AZA_83605 [Nitrospirillum viridazoti Y2]|nr:hypothetical protein AZA_83605 [Nitrospirillum amazonense Y2]
MEEAGAHRAVGLHHRRDPGRVAAHGRWRRHAMGRAVPGADAAQAGRAFLDIAAGEIAAMTGCQLIDGGIQGIAFGRCETHLLHPALRPGLRPVERGGGEIGAQEGNAVEADGLGSVDDGRQLTKVAALDDAARRHRVARPLAPQRIHAGGQRPIGILDATDAVVRGLRPIQGDDDLVTPIHDVGGVAFQQQAAAEQGDLQRQGLQRRAQAPQVGMHQRLPPRQHHPAHAQGAEIVHQPVHRRLFQAGAVAVGLPDVAHDAAAVASAVRHQGDHGHLGETPAPPGAR